VIGESGHTHDTCGTGAVRERGQQARAQLRSVQEVDVTLVVNVIVAVKPSTQKKDPASA
jgi:hypothetical protein